MRRTRLGAAATVLAAATTACGAPAGKATPTPAPPASSVSSSSPAAQASGPGRAQLPSGAVYRLELAKTPEEQAQGLMFRESLPDRTGMLFVFPDVAVHKFWMKNTMIPLDMVWMDAAGKVLFVSANTPPCKADPCPNYGPDAPASSVLEIAGGMAAKENVAPGTIVLFLK
ncbi:MAG: DUF192 domain-containing protein [Acidobacteriota bacterium]|nr:DUF192 domain-containing protein [Acidobacteriota bacterium]